MIVTAIGLLKMAAGSQNQANLKKEAEKEEKEAQELASMWGDSSNRGAEKKKVKRTVSATKREELLDMFLVPERKSNVKSTSSDVSVTSESTADSASKKGTS
mmetsp:Transcript_22658/g.42555  ORF Transcript_22658/g.42555 Transcript_22658/m.42555 type:complete len:102 (-) Transcript_22658:261-566(-)